jgi:hypothetical protein
MVRTTRSRDHELAGVDDSGNTNAELLGFSEETKWIPYGNSKIRARSNYMGWTDLFR